LKQGIAAEASDMAWDRGLAQVLRDGLVDQPVTEKKMFGGIAFLWHGLKVCGVHKGGAMFRVGKDRSASALGIAGVSPTSFTGKPMTEMVDCSDKARIDDQWRGPLMSMAFACVRRLRPKA
jgi:hypothetical protein